MATLNVYQAYELDVDGETVKGGSRSTPATITVTGKRKEWYCSLATSTTATVWDGTDTSEPISNFDFVYIESDQNVWFEFTVDKGNEVGDEVFALEVQANVPKMLTSDDAYANYTANFAGGTEDVIDRIRVRNISGTTASVLVRMIT